MGWGDVSLVAGRSVVVSAGGVSFRFRRSVFGERSVALRLLLGTALWADGRHVAKKKSANFFVTDVLL